MNQGGGFWSTSRAASLAGVFSVRMYLEKTLRDHSMWVCLPCDKGELGQVRILHILVISVFVDWIQFSRCILLIQWKLRALCIRCWEIQRSRDIVSSIRVPSLSIHLSISIVYWRPPICYILFKVFEKVTKRTWYFPFWGLWFDGMCVYWGTNMLEGNEYQEKGKNVKGNWELVEMGRCHLF